MSIRTDGSIANPIFHLGLTRNFGPTEPLGTDFWSRSTTIGIRPTAIGIDPQWQPKPDCLGCDDAHSRNPLTVNGNTVNTGRYTISASTDGGGTVKVTDNTNGESFTVWGDPHITTDKGDSTSFQHAPATFQLPDGTKITVDPTHNSGVNYINNVTITKGNDAVEMTGFQGNLQTRAVPGEGYYLDATTPDGTVLRAKNGNIDQLELPDGTQISGNKIANIDNYSNQNRLENIGRRLVRDGQKLVQEGMQLIQQGDVRLGMRLIREGARLEREGARLEIRGAQGTDPYSPVWKEPRKSVAGPSGNPVNAQPLSAGEQVQAKQIYQYLISKYGFTPAQAAGILGNMQVESGLNTGAYNSAEGAIGLCQWEGGRRTALEQYAASLGKPVTDWQVQVDFMMKELQGSESSAYNALKTATTPSEAAAIFDQDYERSAGTSRGQRIADANSIATQAA